MIKLSNLIEIQIFVKFPKSNNKSENSTQKKIESSKAPTNKSIKAKLGAACSHEKAQARDRVVRAPFQRFAQARRVNRFRILLRAAQESLSWIHIRLNQTVRDCN